ncbi:MAG: OmpA family protein [Ignavibacteriaceae bacterium]|jgi:outer membrane protein OmpA-like peptidoglycan-associated protein
MKLIAILSLFLLGFAQMGIAQDSGNPPKDNALSNTIGVTGEVGFTYPFTDYQTPTMKFAFKDGLEYYFPSEGVGNFGLRVFGQIGTLAGEGGQPSWVPSKFETKITMVGGGGFYTLPIFDGVNGWAGAGASIVWFKDIYNMMIQGDAGLRFMLSDNLSLNLTSGLTLYSKDGLDKLAPSGSGSDMFYTGTAGLTYYFGLSEADTDGDGVPDSKDACPNTPANVKVDEFGCPLDADHDGVPDYLDKCPNTPANVKVDANGCPIDSDRDGVADYLDKCPNTPANVRVDAKGCPLDADGDGVPDYLDKCPNTPANVKVDTKGCPLDSDGDGVPDYLDKCPNTAAGEKVDADGCPVKKEIKTVVTPTGEKEVIVLGGDVSFASGKSKLKPEAFAELDDILTTMKKHPTYKWEIGGYTDSDGSATANQKLSQQRAQAVVNYFVSKGVNKKNLKAVGYGETVTVASNETAEGKAKNRRVEIKVLSKDMPATPAPSTPKKKKK